MLLLVPVVCHLSAALANGQARTPQNDAELKRWLETMVWYHHYSPAEIEAATGLSPSAIDAALTRWDIRPQTRPTSAADDPLRVLPYPGGRHPRIGFLDGAVNPQRETKVSVFLPWDLDSYVVVDIPEAVWSNLGLTYLAHTHVPTIWTKQEINLEPLEWRVAANQGLRMERTLPNGIVLTSRVMPMRDSVRMELTLRNGTAARLTGLRVQNCVMLKAARDFNQQTNENKVFASPYCAVRSVDGKHWIITAWERCQRAWGNEQCPCLHSDPQFDDCDPGQTRTLHGWLSFFEGEDLQAELKRIDTLGWRIP